MTVNINGYEIDTAQKHVAAQGFWYIATKGTKKYFLKQYNPAKPIPGGSEKVYAKNLKAFEQRVEYRTRINKKLRSFTSTGGNIVVPCEEFVCTMPDESGKNLQFYWEATEFIPDVIPDSEMEDTIKGLDEKKRLLILATAVGALGTVHQHNIVHSDLKLGNVLLAKNSAGNIVTKLIDFDGSYFLDDKDTSISGDEVYCSPELLQFYCDEDGDPELKAALNEKSDIFSMGLIFHFYLAGHLPVGTDLPEPLKKRQEKGQIIHCSEVLLAGGKLEISSEITSLKYRLLLQDMLQLDYAKRPSANQVLSRIKEPEIEFAVEEPWAEHSINLKSDKIRAANYVVLRKITIDGVGKYELVSKSGARLVVTKEELVSKGFAEKKRVNVFDEPWPEHKIRFNIDKIKSKKFVSVERATFKSINGYNLYRADNSHQFFKLENIILFGFAEELHESDIGVKYSDLGEKEFKACEPWPEHKITFNSDALLKRGFIRAERAEIRGKKSYELYTSPTAKRFIPFETLVVMDFVKVK